MKQLLICLSMILNITVTHGQKQGNIWFFGNYAGIDFNTGSPTALINGQINALEGTSVISDSSGSLLLYSDGMTVWNKNHHIILNGTHLLGNTTSTQSSIFVPAPNNSMLNGINSSGNTSLQETSTVDPGLRNSNRYYYLFTVSSGFAGGNISDGLRYSKIDICLNNSKGGIIPTEKNIKLADTVAEKIAVTRHANDIDYWILTHKFYSNEFWALRLTSSGIVDTVITAIGSPHTGDIAGSQGQLKFSWDGKKIAIAASNGLDLLEIFDFDKTTGIVSNFQALSRMHNGSVYGVEFSQDGSKLYAVSSSFNPFGMDVSQYDLNAGSIAAINASLNSIYNDTKSVTGRGLQIGMDGKIYMVSLSNPFTLAIINNPNQYGVDCSFKDQSISLSGKHGNYTLPSFIAGFEYSNELTFCDLAANIEHTSSKYLTIYPNPFSSHTNLQTNILLKNATLSIDNCFGQTVKLIKNISGNNVIFHRDNLTKGFYVIRLTQDHQVIGQIKIMIID